MADANRGWHFNARVLPATAHSDPSAACLQEVENAYHSCALLVKLQLVEAQRAGASITIDTNQLENEALLQQIRAREQAALLRPAADFAAKRAGVLQ